MAGKTRSPGFGTRELPAEPTVTAPDGSHVRELLSLPSGSATHFELALGAVSRAGRHRTVDEYRQVRRVRGRSLDLGRWREFFHVPNAQSRENGLPTGSLGNLP